MLQYVAESLEAFLRAATPLSAVDIDVSFETPSEEWASQLTRPMVNVHLWDIRRSATRAITAVENFEREGVNMRRMALPRLELHYFVSAWTTDFEDERTLLSQLLIALLAHQEVPTSFLPAQIAELPNPQLNLARAGDLETWALDFKSKLGLQLRVLAVIDVGLGVPLAPPVSEISASTTDTESGASSTPNRRVAGEVRNPLAVGAKVLSPRGETTVNEAGRFVIMAREGDEIVVETDPPMSAIVPPVGGVVIGT